MKTILVTGFEPFGGESENPSQEIARQLNGHVVARHRLIGRILPCVFGAANRELRGLLDEFQPAAVICVGQAGGRKEITPERVAINVDDARIPDNAGAQPVDRPVVPRGPAAYWSTLPIKAIVATLRAHEIPAAVSQTAGTFVCNHVFYGLMHELARCRGVRGGFIHVPWMPEQAKRQGRSRPPSLSLATMVEAIALAAEVTATVRRDLRVGEGRTH